MNGNTVLVTGGAGFVGSHTCKLLSRVGFLPVVYDNLSNSDQQSVRWGPFEKGSLLDSSRLRDVLSKYSPAAVLHFAASIEAGESVKHPEKFYQNNVLGTLSLLNEMLYANVRHIVFSSTAAVYGQPLNSPISECQPLVPANPYGNTKLSAERMITDFSAAHRLQYCALRYFNAAGADPEGELVESHNPETHLIPLAIQAAFKPGSDFRIFGANYPTPDGTCIRDYVHVMDLAAGHVCALKRLLGGGSSLAANLGTGAGHSVLQVIREVEGCARRAVPVKFADRRVGDPPVLIADPTLAKKELGWIAQFPELQMQVEHAIAAFEQHHRL